MCPNKNSKWWKDLVNEVGESRALAIWEVTKGEDIKITSEVPQNTLLDVIATEVSKNFAYFQEAYRDIFALNGVKTPDEATKLFYTRIKDFEGGTFDSAYVTKDGVTKSIFPTKISRLARSGTSRSKRTIEYNLRKLRDKFGFDYSVIDDDTQDFKGKYISDGVTRKVVLNIAKATLDTPFHEYYHPLVRDIKENNTNLYNQLVEAADVESGSLYEEEAVVEFLSNSIANSMKSDLLTRFLDYVRMLFNKYFPNSPRKITAETTLGDLMIMLRDPVTRITTNAESLEEAYSIDDIIGLFDRGAKSDNPKASYKNTKANPEIDYLAKIVEEADKSKYTTDDTSTVYTDASGNTVTRLTSLIGDKDIGEFSTKYKDKEFSLAEYQIRKLYESRGISFDQPLTERVNGKVITVTFEQLVERQEFELNQARRHGKVVHSIINYMLESDRDKSHEAHKLVQKYAEEFGLKVKHPELSEEFKPYTSNLKEILASLNLRFQLDEETIVANADRIAPEVTVVSELLGIGTTADGLVQHPNGELSLFDWKTGNLMTDYHTSKLMEYGKKFHINDSKLSKAKLELAFRALILKEKLPDAKFKNLTVVQLNKNGDAKTYEVDLLPYLGTIEEYYKAKDPQLHATLKERGLFDAVTYTGTSQSILNVYDSIKGLPYEEQIGTLQEQLNDITLRYTKEEIEGNDYLKQKRALYTEALLELQKLPHVNLQEDTPDIDSLRGQFKNMSDVSNRYIQTLHKVKIERDQAMREELEEIDTKHRNLLEAVLKEQNYNDLPLIRTAMKFAAGAALIYTSPFAIPAVFVTNYIIDKLGKSTMDVWSFMWTKSEETANPGWFMNTSNVDTNTGKALTPAQRAYRDFIANTMRSKWSEVMNVPLFTDKFKQVTKGEYHNVPLELPKEFMPRVFRSTKEIREQESIGGVVKEWGRRHISDYFTELEYGDATKGGMPIRFYGHSGSAVVIGENHSFNVEKAFNGFIGSLVKKKYYDDLLAMAEGTKNALELAKSDVGGPKYKQLAGWLDDHIYIHFLGRHKPTSLSTREVTIPINKTIGKILDVPPGEYKLPAEKLLRLVKTALSVSVMGFKILGATFNGLYITLTNLSQATKSKVSWLVGVPPDEYEPDSGSVLGGLAELRNFYKHSLTGRPDKSKLWRLAEVSGWMPDNLDFTRVNTNLLSASQSFDFGSYAFMFHNFVETYGSLWHLAMMLKSMKFKDADGKTYTAFDAYQIDPATNELKWTKGVRGTVELADGITKELSGLDAMEWKNLRRQYEKLHGSYRQEEKVALESTIWGEFVLQFKRYFPTYLKNLWASPYKDVTVGKYVLDGKQPEGMSNLKWEEQMMEGRYRVLGASFMAAGVSKKKWQELPKDRRKHLATLLNTGLWFSIVAVLLAPDDDDKKDTYAQWRWNRLVEDMSQGAKITDVLHAVEKPVIVLSKISQIYQAMWDTMTGVVTGKRTRTGDIKGLNALRSSVPPFSNWYQLQKMADSSKHDSDYIFGIIPTAPFESMSR